MANSNPTLTRYPYYRINVVTGERALCSYYGYTAIEFHDKLEKWNKTLPHMWLYTAA